MASKLPNEVNYTCGGTHHFWSEDQKQDISLHTAEYSLGHAILPSFHFKEKYSHFTARQEQKKPNKAYWYVYRKVIFILFIVILCQYRFYSTIPAYAASRNFRLWSGYIAHNQQGTYRMASFSFKVPTLAHIAGAEVSIWPGVGNTPRLVQTVIVSYWSPTQGQVNNAYWEFAGINLPTSLTGRHPMGLQINTGDLLMVQVSSNMKNDGSTQFFVRDITTAQTATFRLANSSTPFSDGATVECIVENPTRSLQNIADLYPLANFGTVQITGCSAATNEQTTMMPISRFNPSLTNIARGSTILTQTSPLTNGSTFNLTWKSAG